MLPTSLQWKKTQESQRPTEIRDSRRLHDGQGRSRKDGTPGKSALWAEVSQKEGGQKGGTTRRGVRGRGESTDIN